MTPARLALVLSLLAAPAFAGSLSFDLPNLTWPVESTGPSTSGAPVPAPAPAPVK